MGVIVSVVPPRPSDDIRAGYISNISDIGYKTIWGDLGLLKQVQEGVPGVPRGAADFTAIIQRMTAIFAREGLNLRDGDSSDEIADVLNSVSHLEVCCKRTGTEVKLIIA